MDSPSCSWLLWRKDTVEVVANAHLQGTSHGMKGRDSQLHCQLIVIILRSLFGSTLLMFTGCLMCTSACLQSCTLSHVQTS